jgi:hypothetical protein
MNILRSTLFSLGLFGIFEMLYFNVHFLDVTLFEYRRRSAMLGYHNSNVMNSSDVGHELPSVKFRGKNVTFM